MNGFINGPNRFGNHHRHTSNNGGIRNEIDNGSPRNIDNRSAGAQHDS
jgi:hypothetical protein